MTRNSVPVTGTSFRVTAYLELPKGEHRLAELGSEKARNNVKTTYYPGRQAASYPLGCYATKDVSKQLNPLLGSATQNQLPEQSSENRNGVPGLTGTSFRPWVPLEPKCRLHAFAHKIEDFVCKSKPLGFQKKPKRLTFACSASCSAKLSTSMRKFEVGLQKKREIMNLQIFFQLAALLFIVGAGPLVVVLLASRGGNL